MFIFRIKEIRIKNKVSLKSLSKKTNISRAYLYDLENNRRANPSLKILAMISQALDVNVKDLFYTVYDIDELKQKMYVAIDEHGINSNEALEISQLIDLLINIKMKEELEH